MANNIDLLNAIRMGLNQGQPVGQSKNADLGILAPIAASMRNYQAPNQERHNFFMMNDTVSQEFPPQRRWNR